MEGPRSVEELVNTLQRVVEEQGAVLVASRVEEEERQLNRRLREEQDAAYQAALQADQVCYSFLLVEVLHSQLGFAPNLTTSCFPIFRYLLRVILLNGLILCLWRFLCHRVIMCCSSEACCCKIILIILWSGSEMGQARERLRQEEAERKAREEVEAKQRKREEEEAAARAVQEAAEREAALEERRREKTMALGVEPEKGPDVTQVCLLTLVF